VVGQADRDAATKLRLQNASEVIDELSGIGYDAERRYLEILRGSVAAILGWLNDHPGVLVVAAAGNDKGLLPSLLTHFTRPEPRWPAQYDVSQNALVARERSQVIGVAAVNLKDAGTEYSNRGDVPPLVNGVAVWGGESRHVAGSDLGAIPLPPPPVNPSDVDAIKGVYSAPTVPTPTGAAANETGWVYWSGTSFAAPVISGLAARLWSADPTVPPSAIVRQIVNDLPVKQRATGADDLFAPMIEARQVWQ
jgi:subtilisin family serine protease